LNACDTNNLIRCDTIIIEKYYNKCTLHTYLTGDAIKLSAARVLDGKYHRNASADQTLMKDLPKFPSTLIHPEPGPDQIISTGLLILPIVTYKNNILH
jgi:hypothetical protein